MLVARYGSPCKKLLPSIRVNPTCPVAAVQDAAGPTLSLIILTLYLGKGNFVHVLT